MFTLMASVFAGLSIAWGSLFGGHTSPPHTPPGMTNHTTPPGGGMGSMPHQAPFMVVPVLRGKVTVIAGTTLTVVGGTGVNSAATTTYMVDASNAKVRKDMVASTVSAIQVGDNVLINGWVSGSNVRAALIIDGIPVGRMQPLTSPAGQSSAQGTS